jgi:two-component system sensor histidine kinase UhpB
MKSAAFDHEPVAAPRRDLLLVCGAAALFWTLSVTLELNERILAWTQPWERYQLDELPGLLLFLSLALAWYSWRRVQEARAQLQRRVAAEARLAETLLENRRLSLSHVRMQEDERKQLARELHDELGQHLNAIKIDAVAIRDWSKGRMQDVHGAACAIMDVTDHVQGIIRDMLRRLRPVGLDELGLSAALEHLLQNWRARNVLTRAELTVDTDIDALPEQENITLYRIVQESLNNVARHAQAANVKIRFDRAAGGIVLAISDDGAGAKDWNAATGLGLVGMRERVEALGGTLAITSNAGQGFEITATIPAARAAA